VTLDKLKDLLSSLFTELQDVKSNSDDELLDLLNFMETELIDVGKIVGKLIDSESIIKTAIRLCDHNLHRLKARNAKRNYSLYEESSARQRRSY